MSASWSIQTTNSSPAKRVQITIVGMVMVRTMRGLVPKKMSFTRHLHRSRRDGKYYGYHPLRAVRVCYGDFGQFKLLPLMKQERISA